VIKLEEEALDLRPVGHPDRAKSCGNFAISLRRRYDQTGDITLFNKAIDLNHQALLSSTSINPARWRYSLELVSLSQILSPHLNWQVIISHFYQVFNASSYDDINTLLEGAVITLLGINTTSMSLQQQQGLLALHVRAVDIVALAAGLALETTTQLQHTLHGQLLGPAALHLALQLNQLLTGLQLLERARGVIWSQMLHMRNPQVDLVPDELAIQLRGALYSPVAAEHMLPIITPSDRLFPRERNLE
jgi:hypothetical protein